MLPCGVFELAPSANIVSVLYRAPLRAVCGALRGVGAAGMRHTVSRGSVEGSVKRCVHAMLIVVRVLTDRRDTSKSPNDATGDSVVVRTEFSSNRTEHSTDSFLVSPSVHQEQKAQSQIPPAHRHVSKHVTVHRRSTADRHDIETHPGAKKTIRTQMAHQPPRYEPDGHRIGASRRHARAHPQASSAVARIGRPGRSPRPWRDVRRALYSSPYPSFRVRRRLVHTCGGARPHPMRAAGFTTPWWATAP